MPVPPSRRAHWDFGIYRAGVENYQITLGGTEQKRPLLANVRAWIWRG